MAICHSSLFSAPFDTYLGDDFRDGADNGEAEKFSCYDSGTGLEREDTRRKKSDEEADHRNSGGKSDRGAETFRQAHGCECREDDECGNHDRPHHFHADHDGDPGQNGKDHAENVRIDPRGSGEGFVEGDGEDRFAAEQEPSEDNGGQDDGENHILIRDRDDGSGTEEGVADITAPSAGEVVHQGTDRDRTGRNDRAGGVTVHASFVFRKAEDQHGGKNDDRDGDLHGIIRGGSGTGGNGKSEESDMGQTVPDHGIPLEDKADAENGRAEGDHCRVGRTLKICV